MIDLCYLTRWLFKHGPLTGFARGNNVFFIRQFEYASPSPLQLGKPNTQ